MFVLSDWKYDIYRECLYSDVKNVNTNADNNQNVNKNTKRSKCVWRISFLFCNSYTCIQHPNMHCKRIHTWNVLLKSDFFLSRFSRHCSASKHFYMHICELNGFFFRSALSFCVFNLSLVSFDGLVGFCIATGQHNTSRIQSCLVKFVGAFLNT